MHCTDIQRRWCFYLNPVTSASQQQALTLTESRSITEQTQTAEQQDTQRKSQLTADCASVMQRSSFGSKHIAEPAKKLHIHVRLCVTVIS